MKVRPGEPVFPRIEDVELGDASPTIQQKGCKVAEEELTEKEAKKEDKKEDGLITFEDFQKLDLRVAKILEAEKVEGTDRLLRLQISLGSEERQIVAGVAKFYNAEDLVGRQIVVVANLAPARIRGVESQGMLLAASGDGDLALLRPDSEIPAGSRVS